MGDSVLKKPSLEDFSAHIGKRGMHFSVAQGSNVVYKFLMADQCVRVLNELGGEDVIEKFTHELANFDPNTEGLWVSHVQNSGKIRLARFRLV